MLVDGARLEQELDGVAQRAHSRAAGIYSPDSQAWRLNRELLNFVAGGRAALMQLAHPPVAHAIAEYSNVRDDVRDRFRRTFLRVFAMAYGDLDSALDAARRLHAVHARIRGTIAEPGGAIPPGGNYAANDSASLFWVHATLIDSVWEVRQRVLGDLREEERRQHYQESKQFAALFGIPAEEIPPTVEEFDRYLEEQLSSSFLCVGDRAKEIALDLLSPSSSVLSPAAARFRGMTADLLPPALAAAFELDCSPTERSAVDASWRRLKTIYPRLPPTLRFVPPYFSAMERVGQSRRRWRHRGVGWIGRQLGLPG